jgi:tRNA A-37 threonylcarbamoyl transferase component Bud32
MYFVNWQREVSVQERGGQKVVVKRNRHTTEFHEYVLLGTYVAISFFLAHPSRPPSIGSISRNEGPATRDMLGRHGIGTPRLISISDDELVEEYVEGGDLYRALSCGRAEPALAYDAGILTGKLHSAGYAFIDNKSQNYLVGAGTLVRTDLGFLQKTCSTYARSMDVGSFLASVMDLGMYAEVERQFFEGYRSEAGSNFPYLSVIIRNILSAGFASDSKAAIRNMMADSSKLIGA